MYQFISDGEPVYTKYSLGFMEDERWLLEL